MKFECMTKKMAFSNQNAREIANRKLIEDLQVKKQLLLKQGVNPGLNSSNTLGSSQNNCVFGSADSHVPNASTLAHNLAHQTSFGYYIKQDSSFGNLILPVIPRFDNK